ncbi:MAG: hypothetical protein WCN97_01490 [Thermoleophilia bacterium]
MPNQTDDHPDDPDLPDGLVPYPALSFAAVKWLNQRSGGPTGAYPDVPKALTPLFYDQVDQSQPAAVLRTHREETTVQLLRPFGSSGGIAEADEVLDFIARMDPNETLLQTAFESRVSAQRETVTPRMRSQSKGNRELSPATINGQSSDGRSGTCSRTSSTTSMTSCIRILAVPTSLTMSSKPRGSSS